MALGPRSRIGIAIVAVIVLVVFVPPFINVNRYRNRIASSIADGMGRPVTVGSVSLRLFPQPGFDLGNVSVGEDPAFGIEPMLHAEEVTASLRLSSLWRGRLEVAKLKLKYPSLNLVRAADGRWNLESLLRHASRIPTAPTTKTRPESRPRFPYVEADAGRINIKFGQEKKVYALADADFALWLASEDQLETRLAARLVRTDSYLSDTGTLRFNGRFQRAWDLRDTPLNVTMSLEKSQLGQLTKFIGGRDRGWRGAVDAEVKLSGTPAAMNVVAQGAVSDFRRYDIGSVEKVNVNARCTANYSTSTDQFSGIACLMPVGDGSVGVRGDVAASAQTYDLTLVAENVPVQAVVSVARHAKKNIPDDLSASGQLNGSFNFRRADGNAPGIWSGDGSTTEVVMTSGVLQNPLGLKELHFALQSPSAEPVQRGQKNKVMQLRPAEKRVVVEPFAVAMGGTTPANVAGWFSRSGYNFGVQGESQIVRLAQIAAIAGITTPPANLSGNAKLDLTVAGGWAGFDRPKPTGTIQVRAVQAKLDGVAEPLQVTSATFNLDAENITATNIAALIPGSNVDVAGTVRVPRNCESLELCRVQFDLRSGAIVTDDLNRVLNPRVARRPWYAILGNRSTPPILGRISASGQISATRITIKSVIANHVSANVDLERGKLKLTNITGDVWGGKHSGEFFADFAAAEPVYKASGTLTSVAMGQIGSAMRDNWATGIVNARYKLSMTGYAEPQLLASATGDATFDWKNGSLRHVALNGTKGPLAFRRFTGGMELLNGTIRLVADSKLAGQDSIYQVSGTASVGRLMNFTLRDGSHVYLISGPLNKPSVSSGSADQLQVSLKQ